jgi:hypothetical protein
MTQMKENNNQYETKFNLSELYSLDDLKKLFKIIPELSNLCKHSYNSNISSISKSNTFTSDYSESTKFSNNITKINKFSFFKVILLKLKSYFEVNESFIIMKTLSLLLKEIEFIEKYMIPIGANYNTYKSTKKSEPKNQNGSRFSIKYENKTQKNKKIYNNKVKFSKGKELNNSTILNYSEYNPFEKNGKKNKVYFREMENIIKKENLNEFSSITSKNKTSINSSCNLNKTERRINKINLISSKLKKYDVPIRIEKNKTSSELGFKIYNDSNNDSTTNSHKYLNHLDNINVKEFKTIEAINNKNKVVSFSKKVKNCENSKKNDFFKSMSRKKKSNGNISTETKTYEENSINNDKENSNVNINLSINGFNLNLSLLNDIEKEDFDIFELDKKSNQKSLCLISSYVFNRFGFNNIINYSKFDNWSTKISNGYNRGNPYHTDLHAGDITQSCLVYFKSGKINKICKLNQLSKCALFLSCICHDYKHPGVNNNFLKDTRNSLAIKYNDTSILENMHISESFKLTIDNPDCNIFSGLDSEKYNQLRKEMISCVLYTDMTKHNLTIDFMKEITSNKKSKEKDNHQDYMNLLIHSADISNPTKKFHLYYKWAKMVVEEFFQQGDKEKELGLKCSFDRETTTLYQNQLGFINYIEIPFFNLFVQTFPKLNFLMDNLNNNKAEMLKLQEKEKEKEQKKKIIRK